MEYCCGKLLLVLLAILEVCGSSSPMTQGTGMSDSLVTKDQGNVTQAVWNTSLFKVSRVKGIVSDQKYCSKEAMRIVALTDRNQCYLSEDRGYTWSKIHLYTQEELDMYENVDELENE